MSEPVPRPPLAHRDQDCRVRGQPTGRSRSSHRGKLVRTTRMASGAEGSAAPEHRLHPASSSGRPCQHSPPGLALVANECRVTGGRCHEIPIRQVSNGHRTIASPPASSGISMLRPEPAATDLALKQGRAPLRCGCAAAIRGAGVPAPADGSGRQSLPTALARLGGAAGRPRGRHPHPPGPVPARPGTEAGPLPPVSQTVMVRGGPGRGLGPPPICSLPLSRRLKRGGFRRNVAAPRQPGGPGRAWPPPIRVPPLAHRNLTGVGIRWKATGTPPRSGNPGVRGRAWPSPGSCSPPLPRRV